MSVIFAKLSDLVRSNVLAELEKAQDPIKLLNLYIADSENAAQQRVRDIGNAMKSLELLRVQTEDMETALRRWESSARSEKMKADSATVQGVKDAHMANAQGAAREMVNCQDQLVQQRNVLEADEAKVTHAEQELQTLRLNITAAKAKLADLNARHGAAKSETTHSTSHFTRAIPDLSSAVEAAEASVRGEEAAARAEGHMKDVSASSTLEGRIHGSEVEDRAQAFLDSLNEKK